MLVLLLLLLLQLAEPVLELVLAEPLLAEMLEVSVVSDVVISRAKDGEPREAAAASDEEEPTDVVVVTTVVVSSVRGGSCERNGHAGAPAMVAVADGAIHERSRGRIGVDAVIRLC